MVTGIGDAAGHLEYCPPDADARRILVLLGSPWEITRAKHVQIGRKVHPPVRITSCMIEIDNCEVVRIGRIQRELNTTDKPLLLPRGSEGLPARQDRSR